MRYVGACSMRLVPLSRRSQRRAIAAAPGSNPNLIAIVRTCKVRALTCDEWRVPAIILHGHQSVHDA